MSSSFSFSRRSSGVLMHLTSLPSRQGVGDLGGAAHRFVDFLAAGGQRWWQMLPVGPIDGGGSPYSSHSAMAGSPWLVSLERLVEDGLLARGDVEPMKEGKSVDYAAAIRYREPRLRKAFATFFARVGQDHEFGVFCQENKSWLEDFALFSALKVVNGGKGWDQWERGLKMRVPGALARAREEHAQEILFHMFVQHRFARQWRELREHCHARDVGLIGDIPIFVAYDSCDVWAHRELFRLDRGGKPVVVTGAPPDLFAREGQKWGHPHYRWEAHRKDHYAWWVERFAGMERHFDAVRIDHFLGFHRAWAVPAGAPNAVKGTWLKGPGAEVFNAIRRKLGRYPIIAEDLGYLTKEALALRDQFGFPGMRIAQNGFVKGEERHRPHEYVRECVAYTGTHDNPTVRGWFGSLEPGSKERADALAYVGGTAGSIHAEMIRAVMTSVANTAIVPIQDWLGLGTEGRMNVPGVARGNWRWRLKEGVLTAGLAGELRRLATVSDRI